MSFSNCVSNLLSICLLSLVLASPAAATSSDSFFDVWTETSVAFDLTNGPTRYTSFDTEMLSMSLSGNRAPVVTQDLGDGNFRVDSFFDIFYVTDSPTGGATTDSFFDITISMSFTLTDSSTDHRSWDTEILSMDLTSSPPDGDSLTRPALSRAFEHRGHVTVLKIAAGGGGGGAGGQDRFRIDSFFDIFTEMSVDGGNSYEPATGPSNVSFNTVVPEPSTGALLGLGLTALAARRRRA